MSITISSTLPSQTLNVDTYLSETSPIIIPIATPSNTTYLNSLETVITNKYGSSVNVSLYYQSLDTDFDSQNLFS